MVGANRLRLMLVVLLVVVASTAVAARLYQIQLVMGERFQIRAQDQHQSRIVVPAIRGAIVDRHGHDLAASVETEALYVHPNRVESAEALADTIAPLLGKSRNKVLATLREDREFVYLERFLDAEQRQAIQDSGLEIGGESSLGKEPSFQRVYPHGRLAVHVLGFANIDGEGVEGIEKRFDAELKGDPAVYLVWQDARSGEVRKLIRAPEKEPRDVVLTIDLVLQHIVERELDRAMRRTGARAASAIILDPATGQILALANRPAADLGDYGGANDKQRVNRALVYVYEPGSTFKIVTMAALMERDLVNSRKRVFCENGSYSCGRRVIRDSSPHGMLTPREILAKSSNIGMAKISRSLTSQELCESIEQFGFGAKTGVELPGESRGRVAAVKDWSGYTHASISFGQEILVTVVQMASALATIANDGVLAPPRLVLGTRDTVGTLVLNQPPEQRRVISSETARRLSSMLVSVIESGTGTRAAVPGYRIAGKSGTAQMKGKGEGYSETDYMASFGGFGPANDPRLAALVVLDSPRGKRHQGGEVAAPVFGRIMIEALRHLRVPADDDPPSDTLLTTSVIATRPEANRNPPLPAAGAGRVPDVRGMSLREAVVKLAAHGCLARVNGNGFVVAQSPAAGKPVPDGKVCEVRLEEPVQGRMATRFGPRRRGSS
jgi:cell division protein FtsI (penicillin-binding protein 3)